MLFGPEFIKTLESLNLLARRLITGEDHADSTLR